MNRILTLAALALLAVAAPLRAQMAAPTNLPPIPGVRDYAHWGQVERSYDDDEASTSVSLTLPFDERQRDAFVRRGEVSKVELSAGFVHPGRTMTAYPDIVTLMLKVTRRTNVALRGDRAGTSDISITIDSDKPLVVPAPLVARTGADTQNGRPLSVEDTYVVVLSLSQFLRIVDGTKATAQLHDMRLELTGGPLEGLRDLASRLELTP